VDGEVDTESAQRLELYNCRLYVLHRRRLRDLEPKQRGVEARLAQHGRHLIDERHLSELASRDVDADDRWRSLRTVHLPIHRLPAGLPQHPPPDGHDQARFLRQRQELGWWHDTAAGMLPAHQRLHANDGAALDIDLWLVHEAKLV